MVTQRKIGMGQSKSAKNSYPPALTTVVTSSRCGIIMGLPVISGAPPMNTPVALAGTDGSGMARLPETPRASLLLSLVAGMANGDQSSLSRLYDQTSSLVNGLLLRILEHSQDAEEALLDVYMKAWKNAGTYTPDRGSVQSWLVMMARSIAIDRIRQRRAQPKITSTEFDTAVKFISPAASPEEQTGEAQRRRMVAKVLSELPAEQREVLELAFYGGFTHSELAAKLQQPLGTVKSRIRSALGRLKCLLQEDVPQKGVAL